MTAVAAPKPIEVRQNDAGVLRLQRAASRAHVSAQRWSRVRFYAAVSLAGAGLVTQTVNALPAWASDVVVLVALLWTVLHLVWVTHELNTATRKAALVQERFDTTLFGAPWNGLLVGEPLRDDEVQELVRGFGQLRQRLRAKREEMVADWYDVRTDGVPWPYGALLCQRQNLAWDARLRRKWAGVLAGSIFGWVVVCIGVASATDMSMLDTLLRLIAPSVPAIQIAWAAALEHRSVADQRERATRIVEDELRAASDGPRATTAAIVRQVQDVIWLTRTKAARVPQPFYNRSRSQYAEDFRSLSDDFRKSLGLPTQQWGQLSRAQEARR